MKLSKIFIVVLLVFVGSYIGYLILTTEDDNGYYSGDPLDEDELEEISVSGLSIDDDGEIQSNPSELRSQHTEYISDNSVEVTYSSQNIITNEYSSDYNILREDSSILKTNHMNNTTEYSDGYITYIIDDDNTFSSSSDPLSTELYQKGSLIESIFLDVNITDVERTDTHYVLTVNAGDPANIISETSKTDLNEISGEVKVSIENNHISSFNIGDMAVDISYDVTVDNTIDVEEPSWVDDAKENSSVIEYDDFNEGVLSLDHVALSDLQNPYEITLQLNNNDTIQEYTRIATDDFSLNDTMYIYIQDEELQYNINNEPTSNNTLENTDIIDVKIQKDSNVIYDTIIHV